MLHQSRMLGRLLYGTTCSKIFYGNASRRTLSLKETRNLPQQNKYNVSRYPTYNIKDHPIITQEQMYLVDDKSGFIPNHYHALAYRTEQFECFVNYRNAITKRNGSNLKKDEMELIGLVASLHYNCLYCIVAHSALHRVFSKSPQLTDQIVADVESADLSARQSSIVSFASQILNGKNIEESHFVELRKHGLSNDDVWDIASLVSFTAMASIMMKFLHVQPNEEYYSMGR